MCIQRTTLLALVAVFTVGMTSLASACCNWGYFAPVVTNQIPLAPAPIYVGPWSGSWSGQNSIWNYGPWAVCGCCGCVVIGPGWGAPLYVVNQGPEYSGPGVMIPYVTYSPDTGLAAPRRYRHPRTPVKATSWRSSLATTKARLITLGARAKGVNDKQPRPAHGFSDRPL